MSRQALFLFCSISAAIMLFLAGGATAFSFLYGITLLLSLIAIDASSGK